MANNGWLTRFHLIDLDEVDSTNNEAKRLACSDKSCTHSVIRAKKQTSARGRYGKRWESLEGNLFLSIILPKTAHLETMAQLSFVTGLAVEAAISDVIQSYNKKLQTELKWPNDILINNKKVSGILIETAGKDNEYVVVGIGVNVAASPPLKDYATTSLHEEGMHFISSNEVMNEIMNQFVKYYYQWLSKEFFLIRKSWIKKAKGIGKIIQVTTERNRISGRFIDIDFKGAIRLKVSSGQICSIHAGEVFFYE